MNSKIYMTVWLYLTMTDYIVMTQAFRISKIHWLRLSINTIRVLYLVFHLLLWFLCAYLSAFCVCVSSVGVGWPSLSPVAPLALWQWLWPVHLPPTVWVWWDRVHGRPPHPSQTSSRCTPSPAPRPAAQAPESAQRCQVGPRTHSWAPSHTHMYTQERTNTHTLSQYQHICSVSLFTNGSPETHMVTRVAQVKKLPVSFTHTHACVPIL